MSSCSVVVLVGAIVTGVGLVIGWRRAAQRLYPFRVAVSRNLAAASAGFSGQGTLSAETEPKISLKTLQEAENQVNVLMRKTSDLRKAIKTLWEAIPTLPPPGADINAALEKTQAKQDREAIDDLLIALVSLGITALGTMSGGFGVLMGMVAR